MKTFIHAVAAFCAFLAFGLAQAAHPVVEIVAMPHPPVKMALQGLRDWLTALGSKITLKEIDSESADGAKKVQAAGLSGHIPVLVLVDGSHKFKRKDGSAVEFVNFPNLPNTPAGARGNWLPEDVKAVVTERISH